MARPPNIIWDTHVFSSSISWSIKNNDGPPFARPGIINRQRTTCVPDFEGSEDDLPPPEEERVYFTNCLTEALTGRGYELTSSKSGDPSDPENYSSTSETGTLEGPSTFTVYRFSDDAGDPFEGTPIGSPASISHVIQEGDTTWTGGTGEVTRTHSDSVNYFLSGVKGVYTSASEAELLEPFSTVDAASPSYNFAPSPAFANDGFAGLAVMAGEYAIETKLINLLNIKCRITLESVGSVYDSLSGTPLANSSEQVTIELDASEDDTHKFSLGQTSAFLAQANFVGQLQTTITKYEVDEQDDGNYVERPIPPVSDFYAGMRRLWFQPNGFLDPPQGSPPLIIPTSTFQKYTDTYGDGSSQTAQRFDEFGNDVIVDTYSPERDEASVSVPTSSSISAPVPAEDGDYIIRAQSVFGSLFAGDDPLSTFGDPYIPPAPDP